MRMNAEINAQYADSYTFPNNKLSLKTNKLRQNEVNDCHIIKI